jgi:hypothetical protein
VALLELLYEYWLTDRPFIVEIILAFGHFIHAPFSDHFAIVQISSFTRLASDQPDYKRRQGSRQQTDYLVTT